MTIGAACGAVKDAEKTALQNYVAPYRGHNATSRPHSVARDPVWDL